MARAGDQFSFSLIYLVALWTVEPDGWGSILVFPDILEADSHEQPRRLGINSRFP